jgi:hypothetical protein
VLLLAVLLALQADPSPAPQHSRDREQAPSDPINVSRFEIGPIFQYWFPRFSGHLRVDGTSKAGTTLDLVHDLGLPDAASIPMFGGGALGVWTPTSRTESVELLFAAEYWGHTWAGHRNLALPTTLGDETFPGGTPVESHFHLTSLTLDAMGAYSSGPFYGGLCLSIQVRSARIRIESSTAQAKETIDDLYWGGGLFGEFRPLPYVIAGVSVKGFTSFGDANETGAGDFKFYVGLRWKALSLEGGYRIVLYDLGLSDRSLRYSMYGAYIALNAIWRF